MRVFVVEMSRSTAQLMVKAMSKVRLSDESFSQDELLHLKDVLDCFNENLGEDDES